MTRRQMAKISAVIVIIMLIVAIAAGSALPADLRLPSHWNIEGEVDRFADKWPALFAPGIAAAIIASFFYFLPAMEPRKAGLEQSQPLYLWGWAAVLIIAILLQGVLILTAFGWELPVTRIFVGAAGLLLATMGNQLGKSRSMYMVGIRTPWTLASEEVWIQTHRLSGKLNVVGGLATLTAALLGAPNPWLFGILGTAALIGSLGPVIYSFFLWRRETADQRS